MCDVVRKAAEHVEVIDAEMYAILAYIPTQNGERERRAIAAVVLCDCKPALQQRLRMRTARGCQKA